MNLKKIVVCMSLLLSYSGSILLGIDLNEADIALFQAIDNHSLAGVKEAVAQGANVNVIKKTDNTESDKILQRWPIQYLPYTTPLLNAIEKGHADIVTFLVENGAHTRDYFPINEEAIDKSLSQFQTNYYPLLLALIIGSLEIAKILVDHGSDVNARINFYYPMGVLLTSYSDVACEGNPYPISLLSYEARNGNLKNINFLISNNVKVNESDPRTGHTPLMHAAKGKIDTASNTERMDIVQLLLQHNANINATNTNGDTALIVAVRYGNFDMAKLLVEKGANLNVTNNQKETAADVAFLHNHSQIAALLKKYGVTSRYSYFNRITRTLYRIFSYKFLLPCEPTFI